MDKDVHLIWEAHSKNNTQHNDDINIIIEQILIEEGLIDTVKNVAGNVKGAVKNIGKAVNNRMLQPIINKAIEWLKANDPDALVSLASAAQDGTQALDNVISQEGGDAVEKEIESSPETVNESVEEYKEILREHILYLHHEGLLSNIGRGIGSAIRNTKGAFKQGVRDLKTGYQQGVSGVPAEQPTQAAEPAPTEQPTQAAEPAPTQAAEPAPTETEQPGKIRKILNWVKANPNMSKGIAMGIMGAANVALGAAILPVIATAASGYAIGGGIKGVTKYRQLRAQGVEPKEAIKQAAADAHSAGMTTGTIATGASLAGNLISKGTEMLKSPEPETDWRMDPDSGAPAGGVGDPSNGAADINGDGMVSDQELTSYAQQQQVPSDISQSSSGNMSWGRDPETQRLVPIDSSGNIITDPNTLQQYDAARDAIRQQYKQSLNKSLIPQYESILNRPGWVNKTI